MNRFQLGLLDYTKSSWVLHDVIKKLPRKQNPDMAPVFYKFFSTPDAQVQLKEPYHCIACRKCGRFDIDEVFKIGFFEPVILRFKEDIGQTDDKVTVINDKCAKALKAAKVGGYETKPIGKTGWHAFRVTLLLPPPKESITTRGETCTECGRPEYMGVQSWRVSHVAHPSHENTLYSTNVRYTGSSVSDRDIFLTEDVVKVLKAAQVKGPHCSRLQTDEEVEKRLKLEKEGKNWMPKGLTVYLNGK